MTLVDLGGLRLNTAVDGPEGAPWIILSNSLGASLWMWSPQIAFLTQKYRVLRYDTRGHGGSDTPEGLYTMAGLVGDVIGLMDHFGIEKASFMGLSMGAMTGMGLALTSPERFDRMVLADGRADAPEPFRAMWDDRIGKVADGGLEAIVDGTLATWFTEDWRNANAATLEQVRAMILDTRPDGYIACCRALQGLDYLRHLGDVTVPSLYVGGAQDMGAAPAVMQAMADATPGGRYVEIPNAAHVANINAPEAYNAAIAEFLEL